jgi:hypothetical protein
MTDKPAGLDAALAQLQAQLPRIGKDKTAKVQTREKGTYTYGYANLASITAALKPLMGPLGLAFTSKPTMLERGPGDFDFVLKYRLVHAPSGEDDAGQWPLPDPLRTSPQQVGSAITYARRYALCAVTGVAPDDDDDDAQSAGTAPRAARQKPPERAAGNLPRNRDGSTRRSEVTDDELAASGQMTAGQVRDHNRLERDVIGTGPQGTERLSAVPDDDLWETRGPVPLRTPKAAVPAAAAIHAQFTRLGFTDDERDQRLNVMSSVAGRRIGSTNDLTAADGVVLLRFLRPLTDRDDLIDAMANREEPGDAQP